MSLPAAADAPSTLAIRLSLIFLSQTDWHWLMSGRAVIHLPLESQIQWAMPVDPDKHWTEDKELDRVEFHARPCRLDAAGQKVREGRRCTGGGGVSVLLL